MRQLNKKTFFLAFVIGLGTTLSLHAASIKSMGMAGATTAYAQDSITSVNNPALSVDICDRVDVGVTAKGSEKELTIGNRPVVEGAFSQQGTFKTKDTPLWLPEAGVNWWWTDQLVLGLAWTNNQAIRTHYHTQLTDFSGVGLDGSTLGTHAHLDYRTEVLTATLGYRLNPCYAVGVGLNVYGSCLRVEGINDTLLPSVAPTQMTDRGWDHAYGVGVTLGWRGYFYDGWTLGVSVTPKVRMSKFKRYNGLLVQHRIDIPTTLRAGLVYQASDCLSLSLDGEFVNYSKVKALTNPFFADSFTGFNTSFGASNGPGFGWRDQWIVKAGAEWRALPCLLMRAGYRYEQSPIRQGKSRTALNVFTVEPVQNFVTLGATWEICPCAEISLFGEYGFPHRMSARYPSIVAGAAPLFIPADLTFRDRNYRAGLAFGWNF